MKEELIESVSDKLNIRGKQVKAVIALLSEGATIPFIARYRKEATGYLNEDELRVVEETYNYQVSLDKKKEDVTRLIDEKGLLTPELAKEIKRCQKLSEVELIYAPFKEKRKTKGTEAIKLGLEPLAKEIMTFPDKTLEELAKPYLSDKVKTIEDAITNAGYIIADKVNDDIRIHKQVKRRSVKTGLVRSVKKKKAVDEKLLYEMYYDFTAPVNNIKSYRLLAISRASEEGIVSYNIEVDEKEIISYLNSEVITTSSSPVSKQVKVFIADAYKRLIKPSIEREIKSDLFEIASEDAIKEFGTNLENLLLTPPIKSCVVMGFDPAFRTGCKLAVVNEQGKVLEIGVIYPHEPKNDIEGAKKTIIELINKYDVKVIAIGNGTASRESEFFVTDIIQELRRDIKYVLVSEAGASVYSASAIAKKEFPDYSVEQRSAVSIARRLQDALSELVKIDPKSIGVGLYQHDINQKELESELSFVTSKIVNKVGVNLNNASESILSYVSGLNKKVIKAILDYRDKKGAILERKELETIKGVDAKTYEQSAGFLRILNGPNPLDRTNIHPEDYEMVDKMLKRYDIDITLLGTEEMKTEVNKMSSGDAMRAFGISADKADTIKKNLCEGVIDPRKELPKVILKNDVLTIDDLKIGDKLEGTVRNVLPFGAFVDIGLHDDALVHISKMSKSFINHPNEILKVGDIVTVYICDIMKEKNRVSLSLIKE